MLSKNDYDTLSQIELECFIKKIKQTSTNSYFHIWNDVLHMNLKNLDNNVDGESHFESRCLLYFFDST